MEKNIIVNGQNILTISHTMQGPAFFVFIKLSDLLLHFIHILLNHKLSDLLLHFIHILLSHKHDGQDR